MKRLCLLMLLAGCSGNGAGGGDLSPENTKKISGGMTLAEAEKIIGAKATPLNDLRHNDFAERRRGILSKVTSGATRYVWQQPNLIYYVDIGEGGKVVGNGRFSGSR